MAQLICPPLSFIWVLDIQVSWSSCFVVVHIGKKYGLNVDKNTQATRVFLLALIIPRTTITT